MSEMPSSWNWLTSGADGRLVALTGQPGFLPERPPCAAESAGSITAVGDAAPAFAGAGSTRRSGVTDLVDFLGQYLQNPRQVGSLAPSSRKLARAMVKSMPLEEARTVVEYGPGTGALTRLILERLHRDATYYALEPNPVFQEHLRSHFPRVRVIGDSAECAEVYLGHLAGQVDAVFSGLPFSLMPWDSLTQTLSTTNRLLRSGGYFRTFVYHHIYYLPKLVGLRRLLAHRYREVRAVGVWANLPPAMVVRCVK